MKRTIAASASFQPLRGKALQFKTLTVALLLSWLPAVAVADEVDTSALDAPQFSLGMVGFIGRVSDAEKRMLEIQKSPEASQIFSAIVEDDGRGGVARLYAVCGLKRIDSSKFEHAFNRLENTEEKISVMYGDMMRQEDFKVLLAQIKGGRC
ncbi:hypothetical protein KDH83_20010 [Achromobacter sp. Marseille-Q0513]|uniref:hypothetical protein n=1 Tax=Achromobacter sp. Marseille-Q0513 TaxID=2829161 RepID=UPI001B9D9D8F|nr:hypothetical protein [Achromobacter sp. Marseille-Q0513]MBR8655592.1 hypothetical protein [Achromobacter sp. Marseille-Q0513]